MQKALQPTAVLQKTQVQRNLLLRQERLRSFWQTLVSQNLQQNSFMRQASVWRLLPSWILQTLQAHQQPATILPLRYRQN